MLSTPINWSTMGILPVVHSRKAGSRTSSWKYQQPVCCQRSSLADAMTQAVASSHPQCSPKKARTGCRMPRTLAALVAWIAVRRSSRVSELPRSSSTFNSRSRCSAWSRAARSIANWDLRSGGWSCRGLRAVVGLATSSDILRRSGSINEPSRIHLYAGILRMGHFLTSTW